MASDCWAIKWSKSSMVGGVGDCCCCCCYDILVTVYSGGGGDGNGDGNGDDDVVSSDEEWAFLSEGILNY